MTLTNRLEIMKYRRSINFPRLSQLSSSSPRPILFPREFCPHAIEGMASESAQMYEIQ